MDDETSSSVGEVQLGAAAEATVSAYHELALDPEKRLHLALDDTCLQFLSLVVGNGDNNLVCKALDTLISLAESPECRAPMAATFGVLHCLKASVEEDNEHTEEMKSKSAELFTCLNFAYHQQRAARRRSKAPSAADNPQQQSSVDSQTSAEPACPNSKPAAKEEDEASVGAKGSSVEKKSKQSDADRGGLARSDSLDSNCSSLSVSSCSQPSQAQNNKSTSKDKEDRPGKKYYRDAKHRTRLITLYVKGMLTPHERFSVERALVRVRGVISLVFDASKGRVACRVRRVLDLSKLGTAVDSLDMGMTLFQIVTKPEGGEEIEIPLSQPTSCKEKDASPPSPANKSADGGASDSELPEYLPEDEDEECTPENDPHSAVAPTGVAFKEAAGSLFSAAASFLQQSFYW